MAESQGVWIAKVLGMVVLAAVLTAFLSTMIQELVWHHSNPGVSGGAAAGVAVAVAMSQRKRNRAEPTTP